jgi:hypothetical protein
MVDTGLVRQYLYGIPPEVQQIFAILGYRGGGIDSYEIETLDVTLNGLSILLNFVMMAEDEEWNTDLATEIPLLCTIIEVSIKGFFGHNASDDEKSKISKIIELTNDIKNTVMSRRVAISKGLNPKTRVFRTLYGIEL